MAIKKLNVNKPKADKKLQAAFDKFPKVVKAKEKAAKERLRIMKLFKSAEKNLFKRARS